MRIPDDYLERVYSGVLGKLIGVYLGRPFEGWTHQRIMRELGPVEYFVNDRLDQPLVVTDDDVAGTFTFIRALEDYGISPDLRSEDIGRAWLNYIVEERAILWWGGNGNSTEHTAWLNLKKGVPAPRSGAIATNGAAVAEQIGAQIFIDGWALVAPGRPQLAARLAEQAGRVSHDGESVHAAMLWAAMEAEAFASRDIDRLIDVGLSVIPPGCLIARLVGDVRRWHAGGGDWQETRQKIEDNYGYDRYPGNCHVVPNHALMIMSVLHAPDDFQRGQMIVNTSGWDTDCNAGNVGCLQGIMLGLDGLDAGPDWRGPLADRMLVSSADGGSAINDAVRMAYYIAGLGRTLAGAAPLPAAKNGARYHFSLPGSRQGFRLGDGSGGSAAGSLASVGFEGARALAVDLDRGRPAAALTPVFAPREVVRMRTYELMATPLVYPGQVLSARLVADAANPGPLTACLRLRHYDAADRLQDVDGPPATLPPGADAVLEWQVPDCGSQPVGEVGVVLAADAGDGGRAILDYLRWDGTPDFTLRRPEGDGDFWRRAWVNGASVFSRGPGSGFRIAQNRGEGLIVHGTRQWTDYRVAARVMVHLGDHAGITARTQGLRRYYAARLTRTGAFQIVRVRDEMTLVLAEAPWTPRPDAWIPLEVTVSGAAIGAAAGDLRLAARDDSPEALADGGIGLLVAEGAASADAFRVGPAP